MDVLVLLKTIISGANHEVRHEMLKAGLYSIIDKHNILQNINEAMQRAVEISSKNGKE